MAINPQSLARAVRNIAEYGDTDVLPFPIENRWFFDEVDRVVSLLARLDAEFDDWIINYPVVSARVLAGVGYAGFRGVTQIDPIWNAYLLALVIEIGADIDAARVPKSKGVVFSYRFNDAPTDDNIFATDIGWEAYQRAALQHATAHEFVVTTDIADYYSRAYHHRLENALKHATHNTEVVRRVMLVLTKISGGPSYGLPVGGPAARLLAELLLNRVDRLALAAGIHFIRFVDDYTLFGASQPDAQKALVFLSEALLNNEGLTLSRAKTRFHTKSEFVRSSPIADPEEGESIHELEIRQFLKLRLRYDPYSVTAKLDYSRLAESVERFNITGMLARELRKSRIDEKLVRQLVKSLRFMQVDVRNDAVLSLIQNLNTLYPVFTTIAIVIKELLADLSPAVASEVYSAIRTLIREQSHIVLVPANLAFALRLLADDPSEEADALLISLYNSSSEPMLKRDLILLMARRRVDYWLSALLTKFAVLNPWERRAVLAASYVLADEGRHWRETSRRTLSIVDKEFVHWLASKHNGRSWEIPV